MFFESSKWQLRLRHVILLVITIVLALSVGVFVYASQVKEVQINNKGKKLVVKTMGKTVDDVLRENEIKTDRDDIISPQLEQMVGPLSKIEIKDAAAQVAHLDSKTNIVETSYLINSSKSETKKEDNAKTKVLEDKEKKTEKFVVKKVKVPYKTVKKENPDMEKGKTKVLASGENGLEERTYKIVYQNGKEVSSKLVDKKVVNKPVNKVVAEGTKRTRVLLTSRGDSLRYKRCIEMRASAYDASYESTGKSPGHPAYGITATGIRAKKGVVAVDPSVIPLGSRLYVESIQNGVSSYGYALAADTGGAIKGNKIDLFFQTAREVNNWGVRKVKVYVLE